MPSCALEPCGDPKCAVCSVEQRFAEQIAQQQQPKMNAPKKPRKVA